MYMYIQRIHHTCTMHIYIRRDASDVIKCASIFISEACRHYGTNAFFGVNVFLLYV